MTYGLQLYSVRDLAETDLRQALSEVAALGYENIEFAGFFGHPAQTVKAWLREYGLRVSGTHTGLALLESDYQGVVQYHHDIGCSLLIIPHAVAKTAAEVQAWLQTMAGYQTRLAKDGITLAYHNHAHEFQPVADSPSMWDALVAQTSIPLEMDTYWAYAAQADPVQWMQTLHAQNRLRVIHLKDGMANGDGMPLGLGTAPVKAVHETALRLDVPMVVESETCRPSGMDEARICMDYLKTL